MLIHIPTYAIHHDPEYYDNPDEFDPNRFTSEEIELRPSTTFIPFGTGPRNCIATRFAMLESRISLIKLLQNFEFSICSRTQIPLKYSPQKFVLSPSCSTWLKVTRVKN